MKTHNVQSTPITAEGIKLAIERDGVEIARGFLYVLYNGLHDEPFGFLEDIYVIEKFRNKGYGVRIIQAAMKEAIQHGCYKLIGTSRNGKTKHHDLCVRAGFEKYGIEFRMNL